MPASRQRSNRRHDDEPGISLTGPPGCPNGRDHLRAIELLRSYFLPMASRVLGDAITQQERDARTLAKWIVAERPQKVNLRDLSRGQTGGTALHGLRDRTRMQAAADWLQDSGWFQPNTLTKTGGRPRVDLLIADGLWAALDEHACQNGQNRQNSAVGDTVGGSVGFVGFVSKDTAANEPAEVADRTSDRSGPEHEAVGDASMLTAPVAPEPVPIAPTEARQLKPDDGKVLSLLDRLIAKRNLAESKS